MVALKAISPKDQIKLQT